MLNEPRGNFEQFQPTVAEVIEVTINKLIDVDSALMVCDIPIYEIWDSKDVQDFLNEFGASPIDLTTTTYFGKNPVIVELAFAVMEKLRGLDIQKYISYIKANCISIEEQEGRHDRSASNHYLNSETTPTRLDLNPDLLSFADMAFGWISSGRLTEASFKEKYECQYSPNEFAAILNYFTEKQTAQASGLNSDLLSFANMAKDWIKLGQMDIETFKSKFGKKYTPREFQGILAYIFSEQ